MFNNEQILAKKLDSTLKPSHLKEISQMIYEYFEDVSREFDEFRVKAHICKLRCWYV